MSDPAKGPEFSVGDRVRIQSEPPGLYVVAKSSWDPSKGSWVFQLRGRHQTFVAAELEWNAPDDARELALWCDVDREASRAGLSDVTGETDYVFFKCPFCAKVHVVSFFSLDDEALVHADATRPSGGVSAQAFRCECGKGMPEGFWNRSDPSGWRVTVAELRSSPWRFLTSRTRE